MSGTITGGKTAAQKILAKDPDFFKKIGKRGGQNSTGYAFAHGKADPSIVGKKGGKANRKSKHE